MTFLKISIITPSYNQAQYLEECILSIIHQNYPSIEHIIIDGNSTDNSIEIIKKYNNHIKYWISEPDKGQSNAINKGLKLATGDIIAWINSDDKLYSNALHKINNAFQEHSFDIYCGATRLFNQKKIQIVYPHQNDFLLQLPSRMPTPQPSVFFRKSVFEKTGFLNESLHYAMDMEYLLKTQILHSFKISFTNEILSEYRLHPHSKTVQHSIHFAHEWAQVFYSILKLLDLQSDIEKLNHLNLWNNKIILFHNFKNLPLKEYYLKHKDTLIAYFLKYQFFYYLESKFYDKAKEILYFFKQNYSNLFSEMKMNNNYWKMKLNLYYIKNIFC